MVKRAARPAVSWMPFGAPNSLARHLLVRLLPPLLLLISLNLALTWFVSHKLDIEEWQLGDIIWLMLFGQLALIVALVLTNCPSSANASSPSKLAFTCVFSFVIIFAHFAWCLIHVVRSIHVLLQIF